MKPFRSSFSHPVLVGLRFCVAAVLGLLVTPANAPAQTSLEITQLRLRNAVLRRENKLDDAKAEEVRKLEESALAESLAAQNGLAFRDLSKAVAVREGKPWSTQDEFIHSITLTTDSAVCDPAHPLVARLTQRFPAAHGVELKLSARAFLEPFQAPGAAGRKRDGKVRSLGEFPALPADLIFVPFRFSADLSDTGDGPCQLSVELRDGEKVLHKVSTPMFVIHGFDAKRAELEQRLKKVEGFESVKASIRYPFDFARVLNLGQIEPVLYDFSAGVAHSDQLTTAIESGKDPFTGEHGILARHYLLPEAGEIMPYKVFVPDAYDGKKDFPLIIALHGLGGTDTSFIQGYGGALIKAAGERGFLVASPLGYRRNGAYGGPSPDPLTARMFQLSELDVMNVLRLVREQYKVDPSRIYLMGHSMGGGGTWKLGSKYADIWAALAPIAGASPPLKLLPLQNLKDNHIPVLCVHGDADVVVPVEVSRTVIAELKRLGIENEYLEIKGGTHNDVVGPNCARIVEFFSQHQRIPK